MALLTWREVSAPSFSGATESQRLSGQLLSSGFDSAIKSLDGLTDSQKAATNGELLSRIASYGDAGSLRGALGSGTLFEGLDRSHITPETMDRANMQTRAVLGDQNQSIINSQLQESNKKAAANGELLSRIASYGKPEDLRTALANGTLFEGLDRSAITAETFDRANTQSRALLGDTQVDVQTDGLRLANQNQIMVNDQLQWSNNNAQAAERGRPAVVALVNQIRSAAALGTDEGRAEAARLQASGSKIFADAGMTVDQVNALINGNLSTTVDGTGTNTALRNQSDAVQADTLGKEARGLADSVLQASGNNLELAARTIREDQSINPQLAQQTLAILGSEESQLLEGPDVDPLTQLMNERIDAAQQGGGDAPLRGLMTSAESGRGGYSALYRQSQEPGGRFAGVDVTKMTFDQMDEFEKSGGYGSWVKGQNPDGETATPAGMFQIVGTTRRQVAKEMGLPGNTVFDERVQDAMFNHLVNKRISGPKSMAGKIAGLRAEWEGFIKVPDAQLAAAITAYESGDNAALTGIAGGGQAGAPAPTDSEDLFKSAMEASGTLSTDQNESLVNKTTELGNQATAVMDAMTNDAAFGMQALARSFTDPAVAGQDQTTTINKVRAALGEGLDINEPELTANIERVMDKYPGLTFGQAGLIVQNAVKQNIFGTRWLLGQVDINYDKFEDLVSSFYNAKGATKEEKLRPANELSRAARSAERRVTQLEQAQTLAQEAQTEYFRLREKVRTRPTAALEKELQRAQLAYQMHLGNLEKVVAQSENDPRNPVSINNR